MIFVEEEGKTVDEAVEKALKKLGVPKNQVKIDVIEENKNKGLFGFATSKSVRVKVSLQENNERIGELGSRSTKILIKILELMNIKAKVIVKETKDSINLEIKTEDAGILIGKHGQTLNSLEELITLILNKNEFEVRKRIILDTENYRSRRSKILVYLAKKSAENVIRKKQELELEPMIPWERYIIHSALQNHPKVITKSKGEGIERRVVILPK